MTLTVWSEQGEAKWRDCTQASYLMCLVYGGAKIPNVNTVSERERFEDSEGLPESQQEQGLVGYGRCDIASQKLYGVTAHAATEAELPGLLTTPGVAIALTGNGAGLPGVRDYPSGFTGNHSVTFVPIGGGKLNVYDPLAPMWYDPVTTTVAPILAWHRRLTYGQDVRYVRKDEFTEEPMTKPLGTPTGIARVGTDEHIRGLTPVTFAPIAIPLGYDLVTYGELTIPGFDIDGSGYSKVWRVALNGETYLLQRNATFTPIGADPTAAVAAAVAPLNAKISAAKAALA